MTRDGDLAAVTVPCHPEPKADDPGHQACAPRVWDLPEGWNAGDHYLFMPVSWGLGLVESGEALNANSLDEVPDSAWFTNRSDAFVDRVAQGSWINACRPEQILEPIPPGERWLIDRGKEDGSQPGFRIKVPGKGKYLLKGDYLKSPEVMSAAGVIGQAIYYAAGFYTSCEQVVYFDPAILDLAPGLRYRHNEAEDFKAFDREALEEVLKDRPKRGKEVRFQASAWIPGYIIGSFAFDGLRSDDPNDVVPHEDRRELRGTRLINAWIDHVDSRDGNSLDSWFSEPGRPEDGSPGHVIHHMLDTGDALGPDFAWESLNERIGYSYILDGREIGLDLLTFGAVTHRWEQARPVPGFELFRKFDVEHFVPEEWRPIYFNPAFARMTERDAAWMARILARFTPETVRAFAAMARFSNPRNTEHLAEVLEGRLQRILDRYLTRLSPIGWLRLDGTSRLCGIDMAERRNVREPSRFRYVMEWSGGAPVAVDRGAGGSLCVDLPHRAADAGLADDAPERRVRVVLRDGVAPGPLVAHLYDLGPTRGYRLVGAERPER